MERKFKKRAGGRGILRAIALLACLLIVVLSAGWLYAPTAIPIEKFERGFEATRDYLKDGGSVLIRVMNQPLPIGVSSPGRDNAEDAPLEARPLDPLSSGDTKKQNKRRQLAIGGAFLFILIMFDRWRNKRLEARASAVYDSVRIPFPIPAAHLAGHRTCVDDRPPVTEYKTAKIQPAKPAVLQDRAEETADYRTTKILPGKLIMLNNQHGAEETAVIYLTDPSGRGEVEIGRESPDVTSGVRIKDKANTLSRRQARLVYSARTGEFRLVNLAGEDSNPTVIKGRRMANQETVLVANDDILQMGAIRLQFRQ